MTQNQYEYIIIGAGTSPLTPLLKERGIVAQKNKAPVLSTRAYQTSTSNFSISLKCASRETSVKLC